MRQSICPDCGGELEEGFIPDFSHAQILQLSWSRGVPKDAKFLGMKNGLKVDYKETLRITTSRCTDCGSLKLYALEPTLPESGRQ